MDIVIKASPWNTFMVTPENDTYPSDDCNVCLEAKEE